MSNENWSHNYWTGVSPSTLWSDLKNLSLTTLSCLGRVSTNITEQCSGLMTYSCYPFRTVLAYREYSTMWNPYTFELG